MFERYAIFYTPSGALAEFGAAWLGWDSAQGSAVSQVEISGLNVADITATPRKYGVHGTLKAPFRLAPGSDVAQLQRAAADFATRHAAFAIDDVELRYENGFVALRPKITQPALRGFAAATVKAFDPFRAPLNDAEIARRRQTPLTARQDQQMLDWGYPFIFDDFHFHITLTGALPQDKAALVIDALQLRITPVVPTPFVINAIGLMGQDRDGMFHQIHRYTLTG